MQMWTTKRVLAAAGYNTTQEGPPPMYLYLPFPIACRLNNNNNNQQGRYFRGKHTKHKDQMRGTHNTSVVRVPPEIA